MLYLETINAETLELLRRIQSREFMSQTRLVGGTALALQLGHRISIDLDLFGHWGPLEALEDELAQCGRVVKHDSTLRLQFFEIDGVKVDCVTYDYPWLDAPIEMDGIRLASLRDIAALKINAVTDRGTRKDFIDVAFLLEQFTLKDIFSWYLAKYGNVNPAMALRSLVYFADAEEMPMPKMLMDISWEELKERIKAAVRGLVM